MTIDFDNESGALYITLHDGVIDHTQSLTCDGQMQCDYDKAGRLIGIEILKGGSTKFGTSRF